MYRGVLLVVRPVGKGEMQDWEDLEEELQCNHNLSLQPSLGEL